MVNVDGELGSNIRKVCEDEMCAVYQLKDDTGEGLMTFYQVFPGCMLIYNDFHMEHCNSRFVPNADMFCIDHFRTRSDPERIPQAECLNGAFRTVWS